MNKIFKIIQCVALAFIFITAIFWFALVRPTFLSASYSPQENISVDTKKLYQHVKKLSVDFLPRDYSNLTNLNNTANYIKNQFEENGHIVIEQSFNVFDVEYKNIIANIGPPDGHDIVIGAHYDTAGSFPGADDNASGVAGLIEISRLLKDKKLNKGITLVAYTLEEPPFFATENMGSFVHAKFEKETNAEIDLMISLEMIGYFSEEENSQSFPIEILSFFYPNKGNFIAVIDRLFSDNARKVKASISNNSSIPVVSMNAPTFVTGVDFSDHRNYWAHGYDAVMVTDTSFYRNKMYHTENDTLDRLDYYRMGEVVKGVYGFINDYIE